MVAQVGALLIGLGYNFGVAGPPAPAAAVAYAPDARLPWGDEVVPAGAPSSGVASGAGAFSLGYSPPVHVSIERLGISSDLMSVGLNPDNTVEVPPAEPDALAGWYRHAASPGEIGPAVILGHVDSVRGPGVFYPLGATLPGDRVTVRRADGSAAIFTVDRVASFPRDAFPTSEVYGPIGHAGLRLVTCGGEYDRAAGGYQDNVVVFASLTSTW